MLFKDSLKHLQIKYAQQAVLVRDHHYWIPSPGLFQYPGGIFLLQICGKFCILVFANFSFNNF